MSYSEEPSQKLQQQIMDILQITVPRMDFLPLQFRTPANFRSLASQELRKSKTTTPEHAQLKFAEQCLKYNSFFNNNPNKAEARRNFFSSLCQLYDEVITHSIVPT